MTSIRRRNACAWLACTAAAVGVLLSPAAPAATAGASTASKPPPRVGIIGTGHIGAALATHWAHAGYELMISSRHPGELKTLAKSLGPKVKVGTPRAAATFGDVVVISVPYGALPQLGKDLAQELKGKIVLDTGNPYPQRDGEMANDARRKGAGIASAEYLPGVRLVRAYNAIKYTDLQSQAHHAGELYAIPLAGDSAEALAVASRLVRDSGFEPVVVGGLAQARLFDVDSPPYVKLLTGAQLRQMLNLPPPH